MELEVGMKAIIVNSQHHAEYNFRICKIKEVENLHKRRVYVELDGNGLVTNFYVQINELVPLVYENPEDLKKYGTTVEDIAKILTEYRGYYNAICKIADEVLHESDEKDKKHKQEIDEKNCQIAEMQHYMDCLEADKSELRTRCKESATDSFDKHLYGLLNIVSREDLETHAEDLPAEPIKVAEMLIGATRRRINCMTGEEYDKPIYEKWQLRQIAEHLLVYCNANESKG